MVIYFIDMFLPLNFDCAFYKKTYNDVKTLTDEQIKKHYIEIGIHEGRRYCTTLPQCIKEFLIDENLSNKITDLSFKDKRFKEKNTDINALKYRLQYNYDNREHYVIKNFLLFKNLNNNIVLFSVTDDFFFISDVTHYDRIDAIYNIQKKQLTVSKIKKTDYFIELITIFTNLITQHNDVYIKHLKNINATQLSSFLGVKQIMHHYINELSGLYDLLSTTHLHTIYSQFEYYGKHEEILQTKTSIKKKTSVEDVFLQTCTENLFFIKQCNTFIPESLNKRVIEVNKKIFKKSNLVLPTARPPRKCFLFTVRTSHRKLINQVGFIVTCIKQFNLRFPNSIYLIDGISKLYDTDLTENSTHVQNEKKVYLQIQERLVQAKINNIEIYSLIFEPIQTFIAYAQNVNYYVSHVGTCQHKLGYFSNANGVVHGGGDSKFVSKDKDGWYWGDHFKQKCTCLDNDFFVYDDKTNYNSNYTADLIKVANWAKTVHV